MKETPMMARIGAAIITTINAMSRDEFYALRQELANDHPKSKLTMVIEELIKSMGRRI
jgi:hypothetical protein